MNMRELLIGKLALLALSIAFLNTGVFAQGVTVEDPTTFTSEVKSVERLGTVVLRA